MADNNTAIIAIGLIIIVALTMVGPATAGFGNFLQDLWNFWGNLFEGELGEKGQLGSIGLGVTIQFADGTIQEIKPSGSALFPLTILIDNVPISSITWAVWLKADWTGTLTGLVVTGDIEVYTINGAVLIGSKMLAFNGMPVKNDWQLIDGITLTDTQIEAYLNPDVFFYVLEGYAMCSMDFMFSDGQTTTMNPAMGPTEVFISYETGGLTVFQVDLRSSYV